MQEEMYRSTIVPEENRMEVKCVKCGNIQMEGPTWKGDKFAWRCGNCYTANENGQVHLLEKIANEVKVYVSLR